jgi:hypothetical protein
MPIVLHQPLTMRGFENAHACDEGMMLAHRFLEAADECANTLGKVRTSSSRAVLLMAYNAMVIHADECEKCTKSEQCALANVTNRSRS